jgi:hypothetical protein
LEDSRKPITLTIFSAAELSLTIPLHRSEAKSLLNNRGYLRRVMGNVGLLQTPVGAALKSLLLSAENDRTNPVKGRNVLTM